MKFLVSYYNHKPENKPKLAKYFEAQRLNMERLGYGDDLVIVTNEDIPGTDAYSDVPLSGYRYRYFNKYLALKQVLAKGEAVLMMDHDVFIMKTLKLPEDLKSEAIYSSSVIGENFSEQMSLFTSDMYERVVAHVGMLTTGNRVPRSDPTTVKRHDNCYSSEGTQHNKCFDEVPKHRIFSCYDTLIEEPEDSFNNPKIKTLMDYIEDPFYNIHSGVHVHISAYSPEQLPKQADEPAQAKDQNNAE